MSWSFIVIKCWVGVFGADLLEWFGATFESLSLSVFEVGDGVEESESDPDFEESEEDIVNDPDFDDLVEEEEEQEDVR